MNFGIILYWGGMEDPGILADVARRAEELGYESVSARSPMLPPASSIPGCCWGTSRPSPQGSAWAPTSPSCPYAILSSPPGPS